MENNISSRIIQASGEHGDLNELRMLLLTRSAKRVKTWERNIAYRMACENSNFEIIQELQRYGWGGGYFGTKENR